MNSCPGELCFSFDCRGDICCRPHQRFFRHTNFEKPLQGKNESACRGVSSLCLHEAYWLPSPAQACLFCSTTKYSTGVARKPLRRIVKTCFPLHLLGGIFEVERKTRGTHDSRTSKTSREMNVQVCYFICTVREEVFPTFTVQQPTPLRQ